MLRGDSQIPGNVICYTSGPVYFLQIGCLVKDFKPSDWMDGKDAKRQGRYTQFAMAATKLALEDSKLDTEAVDKVTRQETQDKRQRRNENQAQTRGDDWDGATERCSCFGSKLPLAV